MAGISLTKVERSFLHTLGAIRIITKVISTAQNKILAQVHTNPALRFAAAPILKRLAIGSITVPAAQMPDTLKNIGALRGSRVGKQSFELDALADQAYSTVLVQLFDYAKDHPDYVAFTQIELSYIERGHTVVDPDRLKDVTTVIEPLLSKEDYKRLATLVLDKLSPASVKPAITAPLTAEQIKAAPTVAASVLPQAKAPAPVSTPAMPQATPAVTSTPELFTLKVANGNGGKTYTYYTYPKVDYRPFVKDCVRFSDLDQMALDRQNLETSLCAMWSAISALGSRKANVSRWLIEISQLINTVSTDYGQKIKVLEQAKDLTIEFFIKANDIVSKADAKIAAVKSPVKKEHEFPSEWLTRRRNERDLVWDIETQAIQDLQENEQALSAELQQLGMENAFDQLIRLDVSAAGNYFNALISHLSTERDKKVQEISVSRNKNELEKELEQIIKDLESVNTHRRPALKHVDDLRTLSNELRQRIMPSLDKLSSLLPPQAGDDIPTADPAIAIDPKQAEIIMLTAKVNQLETELAQAKHIAEYIVTRTGANDQFTVIENGTKYHVGDKVMGGEVKFVYQWEGKNLAIVVSAVPMRIPAEIEKELTETKDRLAALQKENETLRQRVSALEKVSEEPAK